MPDDPIDKGRNPEDKLRELFDEIERDHPPSGPSIDEIPAGSSRDPHDRLPEDLDYPPLDGLPDHEELSDEEKQLREFEAKLAAARRGAMPEPPEWNYKRPKVDDKAKDASAYVGLGVGISVGYTMIGCVLVGWGIGKLIDMRGDGMLGQGIGILIGAVVGLVGGIAMIIRAQNKNPKL